MARQIGERLKLTVSPSARVGDDIRAVIKTSHVSEASIEIFVPDTAVVAGPTKMNLGSGTFTRMVRWRVEHVQPGAGATIQIEARAGVLMQVGLCKLRH